MAMDGGTTMTGSDGVYAERNRQSDISKSLRPTAAARQPERPVRALTPQVVDWTPAPYIPANETMELDECRIHKPRRWCR
jgi:hypothetical protein